MDEKKTPAHTPGPWKWTAIGETLMSLDGPVISYSAYEGMWLSRYDGEEDEANARLIAAAPELLGANEGAIDSLVFALGIIHDLIPHEDAELMRARIDALKEAGVKARGGAQ